MFWLQKFQFDTDKTIAERLSKDSLSTASRCGDLSFFNESETLYEFIIYAINV